MIVLLGAHIFQVAIFGAYKKPREVNWWLGLALMGATLGFGLTGYLLPWDQKGYWATQVATNIAGTLPVVGRWVQELVQGGPQYGNLTLTRFYALHVGVLPAALVGLLVAHVALMRKHGITPPPKHDPKIIDTFFPKQVWKDLVATLIVSGVVLGLAMREHGAPLDAPADPASDYPARPEWYFLPLFQLLKYFHGPLEIVGTLGVPTIAGAYLFLLPLLDRKPTTALGPRLLLLTPLLAGGAGVVLLTFAALRADGMDATFRAARKKADERAEIANRLAMAGVPALGPLEMMRRDPELRGEELFSKNCASCHVLGAFGDKSKASAPVLDGFSTASWIESMVRDPDNDSRFGHTPLKGLMPPMDQPPKDNPTMKPVLASKEEVRAVGMFLAAQADGAGAPGSEAMKLGEKLVTSRCTTCHLWKGEGDESGSEYAPELSGYGSVAWVRAQIANPSTKATYREKALDPEHKGHMPRFDDQLAAADIDLLAAWVRAQARGIPMTAPSAAAFGEGSEKASASANASAEATVSAVGTASPGATAHPKASASASTNASAAAAASAKPVVSAALKSAPSPSPVQLAWDPANPTCGAKPLPDCPLQAWMKANVAIASASEDLPALALALDKIARIAPAGYSGWSAIAKEGAAAARAGSLDGARASCKSCHSQLQSRYRGEMRNRPIP
jgi:ubiquinol-cytochrome c reductase cytochrome b subunit